MIKIIKSFYKKWKLNKRLREINSELVQLSWYMGVEKDDDPNMLKRFLELEKLKEELTNSNN